MSLSANISNISRCSLHDGPGVRTVVYFTGCGLSCLWCHNPETFSIKQDLMFFSNKCIGCGACEDRCPYNLPIRKMLKNVADKFGE